VKVLAKGILYKKSETPRKQRGLKAGKGGDELNQKKKKAFPARKRPKPIFLRKTRQPQKKIPKRGGRDMQKF